MPTYKANSPEADAALRALVARRAEANESARDVAEAIIARVRAEGDAYVRQQITKLDRGTLDEDASAPGVAAMAIGTESLPRVDKIAGPGNAYVTAAKARLVGEVGIDMTAGPTELVVIADETADARFVAADLAAQREHGEDSAVILIE